MTCPICHDKGIVRIRYENGAPDDFGVCRCQTGLTMRHARSAVGRPVAHALWEVWAAREQVDHARIAMVEDLLTDADLARIPALEPRSATSDIAAVMRTRKPKL
jgi:hypothetical protein